MKKFLLSFGVFLILVGCGFKPLYERKEAGVQQSDIALFIAYIPEREGQLLRKLLIENLQRSTNSSGKKKYRVNITLRIEEHLRKENYQLDTPSWWDIAGYVELVIIDAQTRRKNNLTALEQQLGIRNDFEGYRIALKKLFYEQVNVITSVEPSAFELAKYQAKEQLIDLLAQSITQELQWFADEKMREENS